ncbi:MAG: protease modulator HflC [bacterium]|nr:protease modulator HflC [bacterium]
MKSTKGILIAIVILLIIFFMMGPLYTIDEGEQAVVIRFGKIIKTEANAGLKFKMPLVDKVKKYTKKILSWDGDPQRFPTQENQLIWVDITARWKIVDAMKFYGTLGTINQAQSRLDDIINSTARKVIAVHLLRESVRNSNLINEIERKDVYQSQTQTTGASDDTTELSTSINTFTKITYDPIEKGRVKLSDDMLAGARENIPEFGIEMIDVIVRQIKYSDDITQNVYKQMIKERNQIAQAFRSGGEGEKAKWLGKMEKELREIRSDAERQAKEIKAKADAESLEIRNKAYSQNAEFAEFWIALTQYQNLLPQMKKILTTDFEFFKYLYKKKGR